MNSKTLVLAFLIGLLVMALAGVRLTHQVHSSSASNVDDTVELIWSFEVRIRLPISIKDAP